MKVSLLQDDDLYLFNPGTQPRFDVVPEPVPPPRWPFCSRNAMTTARFIRRKSADKDTGTSVAFNSVKRAVPISHGLKSKAR